MDINQNSEVVVISRGVYDDMMKLLGKATESDEEGKVAVKGYQRHVRKFNAHDKQIHREEAVAAEAARKEKRAQVLDFLRHNTGRKFFYKTSMDTYYHVTVVGRVNGRVPDKLKVLVSGLAGVVSIARMTNSHNHPVDIGNLVEIEDAPKDMYFDYVEKCNRILPENPKLRQLYFDVQTMLTNHGLGRDGGEPMPLHMAKMPHGKIVSFSTTGSHFSVNVETCDPEYNTGKAFVVSLMAAPSSGFTGAIVFDVLIGAEERLVAGIYVALTAEPIKVIDYYTGLQNSYFLRKLRS